MKEKLQGNSVTLHKKEREVVFVPPLWTLNRSQVWVDCPCDISLLNFLDLSRCLLFNVGKIVLVDAHLALSVTTE